MFESRQEKTVRIALAIFGIILGIVGFYLIGLFDWHLAVGLFLLMWGYSLTSRKDAK